MPGTISDDWYTARVRESLGERYDYNFRLRFDDNADHTGPRTVRLVQFDGILQQALRDVSAWAERGVSPAKSTHYFLENSQIKVPKTAEEHLGIQPVVDLTVNKGIRIDVAVGEPVSFIAKI
ncbi:hypothetical protein ABLO26_02270 [Neobacillus sp. 179-J 1A1 HS]